MDSSSGFPGTQADPEAHPRRLDHAVRGAGAPHLPRVECRAVDRQCLLDHLAVRVLPVRGLSGVHLLHHRAASGLARSCQGRWLRRVGGVPAHRAPAGQAQRRARLLLQFRRRTGTTSFSRTCSCRMHGSSRFRWGCPISSGRRGLPWHSQRSSRLCRSRSSSSSHSVRSCVDWWAARRRAEPAAGVELSDARVRMDGADEAVVAERSSCALRGRDGDRRAQCGYTL